MPKTDPFAQYRIEDDPFAQYRAAPAENTRIGVAPAENRNLDWLRAGLNTLPMAGGFVGGMLGATGGTVAGVGVGGLPGAVAGAGVGGAAGEALRQNLESLFPSLTAEAPSTLGEGLARIGKEAVKQAGYEVGGRVLAGGARLVGKGLMKAALRPTPTLKGQFPNVLDVAIGEGRIPMKEAMRDGIKRAMSTNRSRLMGMSKEMNVALDEALAKGNWYTPEEFLSTVEGRLKGTVRDNPLRVRYMRRLRSMVNEFRTGRQGPIVPEVPPSVMVDANGVPLIPGTPARPLFPKGEPMSPIGVRRMKRSAQRAAAPIYNAQARGADPGVTRQLEGEFQRAVAGDARAALAKLPTGTPGQNVAILDERMRNLIGLRNALLAASNRHYGSGLPMLPPAVSWALPAGLRSPNMLYPTALALTHPAAQMALRQTPRTLAELFQLLPLINVGSSEPDTTVKW